MVAYLIRRKDALDASRRIQHHNQRVTIIGIEQTNRPHIPNLISIDDLLKTERRTLGRNWNGGRNQGRI